MRLIECNKSRLLRGTQGKSAEKLKLERTGTEPSLKNISIRDDMSRHPRRDGRRDESEVAAVSLKRFFNRFCGCRFTFGWVWGGAQGAEAEAGRGCRGEIESDSTKKGKQHINELEEEEIGRNDWKEGMGAERRRESIVRAWYGEDGGQR